MQGIHATQSYLPFCHILDLSAIVNACLKTTMACTYTNVPQAIEKRNTLRKGFESLEYGVRRYVRD